MVVLETPIVTPGAGSGLWQVLVCLAVCGHILQSQAYKMNAGKVQRLVLLVV